jgi:hypothetical protein
VHQLLKNSVPIPEYLLMTDAVFRHADPELCARAQVVAQELEGLGRTSVYFVDMQELSPELPPPPRATLRRRVAVTSGVIIGGMPYLFRGTGSADV